MSHDNLTPLTTTRAGMLGAPSASSAASSPSFGLAQQRGALQDQIETLHRSGALPSASAVGQPGSAVQWNNWSNG